MDEYKKEITSKENNASKQEKFIFWMNYLVADFGRSWVQPLIWYLVMGAFFGNLFYLEKFSIPFLSVTILSILGFWKLLKHDDKILHAQLALLFTSLLGYFSRTVAGLDNFNTQLNSLIKFINPFDTNKIAEKGENIGWWIIFRLFALFIIYQFIISLRRQTKR